MKCCKSKIKYELLLKLIEGLTFNELLTFQICQQCVAIIQIHFLGKFDVTNCYELKTNTSVMNEVADGQKRWLISLLM